MLKLKVLFIAFDLLNFFILCIYLIGVNYGVRLNKNDSLYRYLFDLANILLIISICYHVFYAFEIIYFILLFSIGFL